MTDDLKRGAAAAALEEVRDGMRLGLGTGSTADHFVDLLAERVAAGLRCRCVPTSERTAARARERGLTLAGLDTLDRLDLTVDGADEIGPDLTLIKGAGGALWREKIVAAASDRMVAIADESKLVEALGAFPLPVEIARFGLAATRRLIAEALAPLGLAGAPVLRPGTDGQPFVTDGGNLILDARFGRISDAGAVSEALLGVPGVVQHGLFLGICDAAYVAGPGAVRRLDR